MYTYCLLMEGFTSARLAVVQELLEKYRSIKVKRLFLWSSEEAGHDWFKRLDSSRIDLGKGIRQIYNGGRYVSKYMITVPDRQERSMSVRQRQKVQEMLW
jgi:hypothetical protein